ncbi:MAG: MCE family protein [Thermoleophilaceae bacterium]|nr:MCE family protein [Thermoleophilaceae bacterium]
MVKKAPGIGQILAMVLFTLSVFGLLLFLWVAFGGVTPLKPQGYRLKAAFPEAALLVNEADVRMAGVVVGRVKSKELGENGRRVVATLELEDEFAPIPRDTRAILRQKSLLGETYVELTPGDSEAEDLPDGGTLPDSQVAETVEFEELFSAFDPETRRAFRQWLREAGIAVGDDFAQDFNDSLGNLATFAEGGADLLEPLDRQRLALRRLIRDTGRVFGAASEQAGALRGLIVNGNRTFAALASRDQALADTFQILPTFEREARATMGRLERFARDTDPLVRLLRRPADDLAPTLRDLGDLAPDLERLFRDVDPLLEASEEGVPAAERLLRGVEPVLESAHVLLPELNPIIAYLQFNQGLVGAFLTAGAGSIGENLAGGYTRPRTPSTPEHILPQSSFFELRSFTRDTTRPPWDRGNAYLAPNAFSRRIGLGVLESFDCRPSGGEVVDPIDDAGIATAPPCFVAPPSLFQDQKFPRLRRGRAPFVEAPTRGSRAGRTPAVP